MVWKTGPGKYLFWCHNNACEVTENRNPVWICAGLEVDGKIMWSQPEIILYADEPSLGMSYPDLIVMDGEYRISETQKSVARVHSVDKTIFEGAWKRLAEELEGKPSQRVREGLLVETSQKEIVFPAELKNALKNKGVTFDFLINVPENGFEPGTLLFGNPTADGKGFAVRGREDGAFSFEARGDSDDNRDVILWTFDPGLLTPGAHAVTIIIEAAPRIVTAIVDGRYVDGDGKRIFGWGRYYNAPNRFEGSGKIAIAPEVSTLRVYDRPLRTYEALSNQSVGE